MAPEAAPSYLWIEELAPPGSRLELPPAEGRYLRTVCRAQPGELVTITDGRGGLARAEVATIGRVVFLEVRSIETRTRLREGRLLGGAPEGERADWLIEKLAELGIAVLQPVDFARARWRRAESRAPRWRRIALAALRQSRGTFALEIRAPAPLAQILEELPPEAERWVAEASGPRVPRAAGSDSRLSMGLVGPSAGLTGQELSTILGRGFRPIQLSDNVLRTETAALAWASWWAGSLTVADSGNRLQTP